MPAQALELGTCGTPAEMTAWLKAEGHKMVAGMNRIGVSLKQGGHVGYAADLVTATADFKRWYIIGGDRPLTERSTRMCVAAAGRNLEINDHRSKKRPTVTRYRFEHAKALAECKKIEESYTGAKEYGLRCNAHDEVVRILGEDTKGRIALQGMTDQNTLMTILADPEKEKRYTLLATAPMGATTVAGGGKGYAFSGSILARFAQR